jgi:hypothetical protein
LLDYKGREKGRLELNISLILDKIQDNKEHRRERID